METLHDLYRKGILPGSDYYVYTPSAQAQSLFFYPLIIGNFSYSDDYSPPPHCVRQFSSHVHQARGMHHELNDQVFRALPARSYFSIVIIPMPTEARRPGNVNGSTLTVLWHVHFYQAIMSSSAPVISLKDTYRFERYLHKIYLRFREHLPLKEALFNNYIVNMLTELLSVATTNTREAVSGGIIEDTITYINNHLTEILSLNDLASQASLSLFISVVFSKKRLDSRRMNT